MLQSSNSFLMPEKNDFVKVLSGFEQSLEPAHRR